MNFILLGYIIAWIAVIVVLAAIAFALYEYSKLTPMQQAQIETINKRKQLNNNTIKVSRGINSNSKAVQFPLDEKLANGKHRFFYKHDMLVDRLI